MTTNPNALAGGHQAEGAFRTGTQAAASAVAFEASINRPEVARRREKRVQTVDGWRKKGLLLYYKIGRSVAFRWSRGDGN